VRVQVAATAVNRADLLQRMGLYPGPPMPQEIPGLEFAGTVVEIGGRVTGRAVGDAVMGVVGGGAYAEQVVVHERQTMAVPARVGLPDAGAVPEVAITAYDALVLQGGLTAGGWALVHAGASGVGTAAIQLVRAIGARVVVTCSSGKVAACRELGADVVVDYSSEDFVEAALAATGGRGVDVVLDVVGGDYVARNLRSCRVGGSIVQVGIMGGGNAEVPVGLLLTRRVHWIGTVLRGRPIEEKIAVTRRCEHDLVPLYESGVLRPVIDRSYPLERVAEAHEYVGTNANVGKVLLTI
jgi:putative PIG3 family NAD(P)H quinone oxidoreductase